MTQTLLTPQRPTTTPPLALSKPDGSCYGYQVILPMFRAYADSLAALMPILLDDPMVPEYATATEYMQLIYRLRIAIKAQICLQAPINAQWLTDPRITVTAEERTLLTQDRGVAVEVDEWTSPVPLVLIWTDYAPFSTIFRPTGAAIQWIDPTTEESLVRSLDALGYVAVDGVV